MENIIRNFDIDGQILYVEPLLGGLVNKTYLVATNKKKYLLQKINKYVFKNPVDVMMNIDKITKHIKNKNEITLNIIKSTNSNYYCYENEYYRMYDYLDNCCSIEKINNNLCTEIGKSVGKFQYLLYDYNPRELIETIYHFHHLPDRIKQLKESFDSLSNDDIRKNEIIDLYQYIIKEAENNYAIDEKIDNGLIPIRIVHNDTKLNNVMFNKNTMKAITLIDLDTVMPGTILYDYGDMIRSNASISDENEKNLNIVKYNDEQFIALSIGYLSKMYDKLTYDEIKELVNAIGVITLECSCRFLTDYLNYDKYFRIEYEKHNKDRAFNQITLYKDFLNKKKRWKKLIMEIYHRLMINK